MPFNNGANRLKSGARQGNFAYLHNSWVRRGRRSLLGGERGRLSEIKYIPLTNPIMVTPLNQIEMDMAIVIGIGAVTEHGRETSTGTLS